MIDKYVIYDCCETTVPEAVGRIIDHRAEQEPFELRVEAQNVSMCDDKLEIRGFNDNYSMTQFSIRSLCNILDVPVKMCDTLSSEVLGLVITELLHSRDRLKLLLRCGQGAAGPWVRAVLASKHGVMDDKVLFEPLIKSNIIDCFNVKVIGFWQSDSVSAIRCIFADRELEAEGYKVYQGFDISNSEVLPNQSWVKGVIHFVSDKEKFTIISPKVISSMQNSNKNELLGLLKKFEKISVDSLGEILSEAMTGLFEGKDTFGNIIEQLHKKQGLLSRKDVYSVHEAAGYPRLVDEQFSYIFSSTRAESDKMTYFDFVRYLLKYAETIDSYAKRSALEFIPNLFVKKVAQT